LKPLRLLEYQINPISKNNYSIGVGFSPFLKRVKQHPALAKI
tara:strand:- start:6003 stop:6128 length:126 start_codon:yes stop_codon:yes gene_type:complete